jgi:hypothetical protein
MANIGAPNMKLMLDWNLGGAAATQPPGRFAALCLGTPTSITGSPEVQANSGYLRQTALFGAAASPAGSASNTAAMTFGPFSSSAAIQGLMLYDTASINSGTLLWYGTLLTARTVLTGDTLVIGAGSLLITLF